MYEIQRTSQARKDMRDIAHYTYTQWGKKQVMCYMMELEHTISMLKHHPETQGHARGEKGIRIILHRDHYVIAYRIHANHVELLRVLHQRRNWQQFFPLH